MAANIKTKTSEFIALCLKKKKRKKASNGMKMGRKKKEKTKTEVEVFRAVLHVTFLPERPIQTRQPSGIPSKTNK
jgi:hypothetical protein